MNVEMQIRSQKLDNGGRSWGSAKRKSARVSLRLQPGEGIIRVNGLDYLKYFRDRKDAQELLARPFSVVGMRFNIDAKAQGGGLHGQIGALQLAISRAIVNYNPNLYPELRSSGLMTPDTRRVQSKMCGKAKARKGKPTSRR
jgi:small subunit ribosomal protein S9